MAMVCIGLSFLLLLQFRIVFKKGTREMNAFEEFMFDESYVLRFYRVDHGLVCTINESMVSELREVESKLRQQQAEIEELKAKLQLHEAMDNQCASLMQQFRKAQEK